MKPPFLEGCQSLHTREHIRPTRRKKLTGIGGLLEISRGHRSIIRSSSTTKTSDAPDIETDPLPKKVSDFTEIVTVVYKQMSGEAHESDRIGLLNL